MLTNDLQNLILGVLNGDPFVFDEEADDLTQFIADAVVPYQTTWVQFVKLAYKSFYRHEWLRAAETISRIWSCMVNQPEKDWGLKYIPKTYPNIHKYDTRWYAVFCPKKKKTTAKKKQVFKRVA